MGGGENSSALFKSAIGTNPLHLHVGEQVNTVGWLVTGKTVQTKDGDPGRDPRERVVTVAYYALVNIRDHKVQASTDARNAAWFAVADLPSLAFDHDVIIETARMRLRGKPSYQPICFELLPWKFTLSQLQRLYETILEKPLDKRNFRRKILGTGLLKDTDEIEHGARAVPQQMDAGLAGLRPHRGAGEHGPDLQHAREWCHFQ